MTLELGGRIGPIQAESPGLTTRDEKGDGLDAGGAPHRELDRGGM